MADGQNMGGSDRQVSRQPAWAKQDDSLGHHQKRGGPKQLLSHLKPGQRTYNKGRLSPKINGLLSPSFSLSSPQLL